MQTQKGTLFYVNFYFEIYSLQKFKKYAPNGAEKNGEFVEVESYQLLTAADVD